jgi:hypothetical protein
MDTSTENHIGNTVRIRRPPRVLTDALGRNTWMGGIEPCDLNIEFTVSTDAYNRAGTDFLSATLTR